MLTEASNYDDLYRGFRWDIRRGSTSRPRAATVMPMAADVSR